MQRPHGKAQAPRWPALAVGLLVLGVGLPATGAPDFEPTINKPRQLHTAHLGYVAATADPYSALVRAAQLPDAARATGSDAGLRVRLAELAADYGLLDQAMREYRRVLTPEIGYRRRNRDWYELSRAWALRGDSARAKQAVDQIFGAVPDDIKEHLPPYEGRLLIAEGQDSEAVDLLRKWRRKRIRNPFARFNLGVALARAGLPREGAGELNEVGTLRSQQDKRLALRDHANLVLGFGYLEIGQGATARALFQRVRLNGPFSDKALLGLGWAEIAPDGEPQEHVLVQTVRCVEDPARLLPDNLPVLRRIPRKACGPPEEFRSRDEFKTKSGGETEADRYSRALVPWSELVKRDAESEAVQEGLVALPYALAKLGAARRADDNYATAIRRLQPKLARLNTAIEALQQPAAAGQALPPAVEADRDWFAQRWGLYGYIDSPFFTAALSQDDFRVAAQNLQDLLVLRDQFANNQTRLETLRAELQGRRAALARAGIAIPDELREQQRRLVASTRALAALQTRLQTTTAALSNYLRGRMLASAETHAERLATYLTSARIGRANLAEVSVAEGATP